MEAQQWLEQNYPQTGACQVINEGVGVNNFGKTRSQITNLLLSDLTGGIFNLIGFANLTELGFKNCNLVVLKLDQMSNLRMISVSNTQIGALEVNYGNNGGKDLSISYDILGSGETPQAFSKINSITTYFSCKDDHNYYSAITEVPEKPPAKYYCWVNNTWQKI